MRGVAPWGVAWTIYTETYVWLHSRLVPGCSVLLEEGGGRTLGLFSRRVLCTSLGVAPAGSKHSRGLNGLSSIRAVFGCNTPLGVEKKTGAVYEITKSVHTAP